MPVPATGAITAGDLNLEIVRAGATAAMSMDTIRIRYGLPSGAISFNDLRKAEGFIITCGTVYSPGNKFDPSYANDGWANNYSLYVGNFGSVNPSEVSGGVQYAANSFVRAAYSANGTSSAVIGVLASSADSLSYNGHTTGFDATNITRIVTANTSRTVGSTASSTAAFTYSFPKSGTIHCLVKF